MIVRFALFGLSIAALINDPAPAEDLGLMSCTEVSRALGDSSYFNRPRIKEIVDHVHQRFIDDDAPIVGMGHQAVAGRWSSQEMLASTDQVALACEVHGRETLDEETDAVFSGFVTIEDDRTGAAR